MFKTNHILKIYHIFNTQKRIEAKKKWIKRWKSIA